MNELADLIITKLELKQQQWDEEFHSSIADIYGQEGHKEAFIMSEEEMLIGELARLQTILMIFENNEECRKKIWAESVFRFTLKAADGI